jgi:hypothetical protein
MAGMDSGDIEIAVADRPFRKFRRFISTASRSNVFHLSNGNSPKARYLARHGHANNR